ncbi:hypothetical protein [Streptomyces atratus]|uniref:hypothetical protein n=1 Tax=Streptomyces atratus TaxID=1893 RepID=UPI000DEEDD36|nr:hypothetical protein [Streptomyces atratus]
MTLNAACAAGGEQHAGRLAVGHRADLTIFAGAPLRAPATDLPQLPDRTDASGARRGRARRRQPRQDPAGVRTASAAVQPDTTGDANGDRGHAEGGGRTGPWR